MLLTTKDLRQPGTVAGVEKSGSFLGAKFIISMNDTDEMQGWVKFWAGKTVVVYERGRNK